MDPGIGPGRVPGMGFGPSWRAQKVLAVLLLLAVLAAVWLLVVAPVISGRQEVASAQAEAADLLERYGRIAAQRPSLEARIAGTERRHAASGLHLEGETDALAAVQLQQIATRAVTAGRGEVTSMQPLQPELGPELGGGYRRIGLRLQFTGTIETLLQAVHTLEAGPPLLVVDNLEVRARTMTRDGPAARDGTLTVRLDVFGFTQPGSA
ncbi:MAG TPA: type II secretion system protein GspM [Arenibaculum sp.]|nr:type II secretion system protein GspM [Arenibaculum sp.]